MKVALVHELLTMKGGAERLLRVFAEMFPDAPIYTLLYNEKKLGDWFPKERVRTPKYPTPYALLPTPFKYNHHLYLRKFPQAVESWDFSEFDLVISESSAFVHNIITNCDPKHISFINSPARYLWDRTHDVLGHAGLSRWYLERTFHKLRTWDAECAARADLLVAASKEVQRRIELYWRRESDVIYPPIDDEWLQSASATSDRSYYLIVSTLVPYKRNDLAVEACNTLKSPLKVVGEGSDRKHLSKIAGPTVEVLGFKSQEELKALYANAKAVLFPGDEDFGLVPLEAMSQGTPVIAYRSGGALETIKEGETGEFFDNPTAKSLAEAILRFESKEYDVDACRAQAQRFSKENFVRQVRAAIEAL